MQMHPRKIDAKVHAITQYKSARSFLSAPDIPKGFLTIIEQGLPIDILAQYRGFDTTIIFMHGAIEPTRVLPETGGLGISFDLAVNRIFLTDPSLYLSPDIRLAWFAGNKKLRLQVILHRVLKKIVDSYGNQRVVFFGSSGGGFASLFYSSLFPESRAIVVNPQTDISRHSPSVVQKFAEKCFDIGSGLDIHSFPSDICYDLTNLYSNRQTNSVAYIQNLTDSFHVNNHFNPFMEAVNESNQIKVLMSDEWDRGHTPPPKPVLKAVLRASALPDWSTELVDLGFNVPDINMKEML